MMKSLSVKMDFLRRAMLLGEVALQGTREFCGGV